LINEIISAILINTFEGKIYFTERERSMRRFITGSFCVIAVASLLLGLTAAAYAQITNGGFETGDFTGWTASAFINASGGPSSGGPNYSTFLTAQAAGTPTADSNAVIASQTTNFDGLSGLNTAIAPVQGSFLAFITNETSAGNSTLTGSSRSQTFTIPAGATTLTLSLMLLNNDSSGAFVSFDDFGGVALTQGSTILAQYNADLDPASAADLHVTVGTNQGGFLNSTPWKTVSFNVAPFAGQSITLTAYSLQYGGDNSVETRLLIDGISVGNAPPNAPTSVPTMTEWGMMIFMMLAGLGSVYYLRRQKRES
jgi:hypothetical protein